MPDLFAEYAHDFTGYCRDLLGMPTHEVQDAMADLVDKNSRVAVYGCHSSTKSHGAAALVCWWVDTRDPAWVVTTAPGGRQVQHGLWRLVRNMRERARKRLPGKCLTKELRVSNRRMAIGFTARYGDAVQGLRESANVLVIEDEATRIDDNIHESLLTLVTTPGSCFLMLGNPTSVSGHFRDACTRLNKSPEHPDGVWSVLQIDGHDIVANPRGIPGVITQAYIDERAQAWGVDSPIYRSRVRGEWVELSGSNLLIRHSWVRAAQERWDECAPGPEDPKILLADVGSSHFGDPTAVYMRHGRRFYRIDSYHEDNLIFNAARILAHGIRLGVEEIRIDATGVGKGTWQELERLEEADETHGIRILGIKLGKSANDPGFNRVASRVLWQMSLGFDPHGEEPVAIDPGDAELAEQLPWRTWELDEKHRINVESKKRLRKRTGRSPDAADAVSLAFYEEKTIWMV